MIMSGNNLQVFFPVLQQVSRVRTSRDFGSVGQVISRKVLESPCFGTLSWLPRFLPLFRGCKLMLLTFLVQNGPRGDL